MSRFMVKSAASWHSAPSSAPEQPSVYTFLSTTVCAERKELTHQFRERANVYIWRDAHTVHPNSQYLRAPIDIWGPDVNDTVEPPRAEQRAILYNHRQEIVAHASERKRGRGRQKMSNAQLPLVGSSQRRR